MNFYDLFNVNPEEKVAETAKKNGKKETKANSSKKPVQKVPGKIDISAGIMIHTGYYPDIEINPEMFGGRNEVDESEIICFLSERYPEYNTRTAKVVKADGLLVLFRNSDTFEKDIPDEECLIRLADYEMPIPEFVDELTVESIREAWVEQHPCFKDCEFVYDELGKFFIPLMKSTDIEDIKPPAKISILIYGNQKIEISEEEKVITKAYIDNEVLKNYPYLKGYYKLGRHGDTIYIIPSLPSEAGTAEKEKTYKIKDTVLSLLFTKYVLKPDDFGKDELTKKEVCHFLRGKGHIEFADERTEIQYDEKENLMIPTIKSSRKG